MPRALSSLVATAAALLLLAGCSDDAEPEAAPTPTPDAQVEPGAATTYEAGLARLYVGDSTDPQEQLDGACFAAALLERLDTDALTEAGIITPQGRVTRTLPVFDEATATVWADAQLSCVDYVEASTRALLTQRRGDLDAEAYAACLRDALSAEEVRAALVQTLSGGFDSPEVAALATAQVTCAG